MSFLIDPFKFGELSVRNQKLKKQKWQCCQYLDLNLTCEL